MSYLFSSDNNQLITMTYWYSSGYNLTGQQSWSSPTTFLGEYQSNLEIQLSDLSSEINDNSFIHTTEQIPIGSFVVRYESANSVPESDAQEVLDVVTINMITDPVATYLYKV